MSLFSNGVLTKYLISDSSEKLGIYGFSLKKQPFIPQNMSDLIDPTHSAIGVNFFIYLLLCSYLKFLNYRLFPQCLHVAAVVAQ